MKKNNIKELAEGDNTFYQFDKNTGFWGIPSISHMIKYPVAPNKVFRASHNSYGNRDDEPLIDKKKKNYNFSWRFSHMGCSNGTRKKIHGFIKKK